MLSIPEESTQKQILLKRLFLLTMYTRISKIIKQTFWTGPLGKTGKEIDERKHLIFSTLSKITTDSI